MSDPVSSLVFIDAVDPTPVSDQDRTFLQQAQIINLTEISEGRLALTHDAGLGSREFGRWMIGDHAALGNGLAAVANQLGVTLPTTIDAAHQAELSELAGKSGTDFDQTYAAEGVQGHAASIALFEQEAQSGSNPTLVSLAQQTLPLLQAHYGQAQALATGLGLLPDTTTVGSSATVAAAGNSGAEAANNPPLSELVPPLGSSPTTADPLSAQDTAFIQQVGASNLAEIAEGQIAASHTSDVPTSEFGNWMVADHTALNATLTAVAGQQGVTVPAAVTAEQQAELNALQSTPDDAFASTYASAQIVDHARALMSFITEATMGQNADLTAFARNTVPILAQHLVGAIDLENSAGGVNAPQDLVTGVGNILVGAAAELAGSVPNGVGDTAGADNGGAFGGGLWNLHAFPGVMVPASLNT